jgi:hypothetical protein
MKHAWNNKRQNQITEDFKATPRASNNMLFLLAFTQKKAEA